MPSPTYDRLFATIEELVMHHSPSGVEGEIDRRLIERFNALGLECRQDGAGNVIAKLRGQNDQVLAITAHKDEIGGIVKAVLADGRLQVRALGGAFPWVYGEGIVDLIGDLAMLQGVLSFGSRHVSHESPQKLRQDEAPLRWQDAWVETKSSPHEIEAAGVRPGTRMVIGKHRKRPCRIKDYIASYTLDNKASLAILLGVAERLAEPGPTVYLVASAKEEVGGLGALYFTQRQALDTLIALEVAPLAPEYPIQDGEAPVLLSQDGYGLYDEALNAALRHAAGRVGIAIQHAAIAGFGSDASMAMKYGHVARAACLGFPTQNTHGYEIAHLGAIENCIAILCAYCEEEAVEHCGLDGSLQVLSAPSFGSGEAEAFEAVRGPDGIQRVRVLAGSYFFRPRQIRVQVGATVEFTIALEPGLVPHDFVIDAPETGISVRETLTAKPKVIRFSPTVPGRFEFYCSKRLLFFESHKDKGMRGTLEVVP